MHVSINMGTVLNPLASLHGRSLWLEYKQEYRTREIVRESHSVRGWISYQWYGLLVLSWPQHANVTRNTQGHGPLWTATTW